MTCYEAGCFDCSLGNADINCCPYQPQKLTDNTKLCACGRKVNPDNAFYLNCECGRRY